jgi:pimeloyl-ACP methyl ester carboxylesterase
MKTKIFILLTIIIAILVIPFLIPITQLEGLVDSKTLVDDDSRFININSVDIHYKDIGEGENTYILLHGFGASIYSWREVIPFLSENSRVVVFDRPAFGLTERLVEWEDFNPYTPQGQVDITIGLMDELNIDKAILMGHSAGGLIAVNSAIQHPERITELILIAPAIYEVNMVAQYLRPLLNIPQIDRLGPLFVRRIQNNGEEILKSTWYDGEKITKDVYEEYSRPLNINNWDIALWNLTKYTYSLRPDKYLDDISADVLIVTGENDTLVRTENSVRLSNEIPNASIEIIESCGHVPHEECSIEFLDILNKYISD